MAAKRKDDKGRILKKGERQRSDGTYEYRYQVNGRRQSLYAVTLDQLRRLEISFKRPNELSTTEYKEITVRGTGKALQHIGQSGMPVAQQMYTTSEPCWGYRIVHFICEGVRAVAI